jgi:hypothetical protein
VSGVPLTLWVSAALVVLFAAADDDTETIRDMLRHNGCQAALFEYTPAANGAFSR